MITKKFKFKDHYIIIEAIYLKGYPATLEEPAEDETFEIQSIIIGEKEFEDVEELANFLNIDEKELDYIIDTHLKTANDEYISNW